MIRSRRESSRGSYGRVVTQSDEGEDQAHRSESASSSSSSSQSEPVTTQVSMEAAIELVGMGKFQYVILVASGMCFASDAMQVILLSFLTIVLKGEWNLSGGAAASIASCLFAGSLVGTLVLGPLADSVGRRPIFLVSAAVISVAGFCTASAPNLVTLMACIFIVGFGVGGLTVPFDILAELLPAEGRGHHLLLIEYFWTAGCLYVVVVAYFFAERHWRILAALSTVPCVISLVLGFFVVPESPRWLSARGRREEAMNILRNAAAVNGRNVDHVLPPSLSLMQEPEEKHASLAELFEPKWREIILRLWGTWFSFAFGYYGTLLAVTRVFASVKAPQNDTGHSDEAFDYSAIFVSSAAEMVGLTLVIMAVDRVGRIPSQAVSYSAAGISVFLLCALGASGSNRQWLVIFGFLARVFEMAGTCVTWVSTAEILSTDVRSSGHSTANAMGRAGAFLCPFLVESNTPLLRVGVAMLIVHACTVISLSKLPETKGKGMGVLDNDNNEETSPERLLEDGAEECDSVELA